MDLTDIIYSNDYINILIQNYVAQSERYQMLFPESSALLTLNSQYSVLFSSAACSRKISLVKFFLPDSRNFSRRFPPSL